MPSRIFSVFGSYDFYGKSFPGITFLVGILPLLPEEWLQKLLEFSSFNPDNRFDIVILIIIIILLGTLIGEAVHALAIFIEHLLAWFGNRIKNMVKIISREILDLENLIDSILHLDEPSLRERDQSSELDSEEQATRGLGRRLQKNWLYGTSNWIRKRINGVRLAFVRHRILFTSKIIRPLSRPHEGPKKTSISDLDTVQHHLVKTVQEEFAVINRNECAVDLEDKLANIGEDEFRGNEEILRKRDAKSVYPVITTLLSSNGINRPDELQARYSFCRSMWVVLLLIIISYILLPFFDSFIHVTTLLFFDSLSFFDFDGYRSGIISFITDDQPIEAQEIWFSLPILALFIFMVFFLVSAGKYKKYYVEYLLSGFYTFSTSIEYEPGESEPEFEENNIRYYK